MQMNCRKKMLSFILCMVLTVAVALCTTGCNGGKDTQDPAGTGQNTWEDGSVIGEGSREFSLTVTDKDGKETHLTVRTEKETVGEALTEHGVIAGEDSEYGLFVKTVNGLTVDYDADGAYWAFYVNDEYAQTGVDSTAVTEGESYSFKVEQG